MPALLSANYTETCLWQTQASPPPASTGALPAEADLVIVGGGLCGLAAADTAAQLGMSVVVLEKEALGWGASSRNGGMVIPELKAGPRTLRKKYGDTGADMYREVNEAFDLVEAMTSGSDGRAAIDCDYRRAGQLYLAHSERHVPELRDMAAEHAALGEDVRFLADAELATEIGSAVHHAGVLFDRVGGLHPAKFHAGVARRALDSGAQVHDRTAVTGMSLGESGHIVHTTRGSVAGHDVLVATNAYADDAVPQVKRRVQPISSYVIATEVLDPELAAAVSPGRRMMVDTKNLLFYWRLSPDGRMVFGGRRSLDPVDIPVARDFLYDAMLRMYPQLHGVAVEHAWGGSVAMTLDRLPHAGRIDGGAWYATGCNGSGVATNTWLGHRLALTIAGEEQPPALSRLRHRAIPMRSWSGAYLPVVGRWFTWQDSR